MKPGSVRPHDCIDGWFLLKRWKQDLGSIANDFSVAVNFSSAIDDFYRLSDLLIECRLGIYICIKHS